MSEPTNHEPNDEGPKSRARPGTRPAPTLLAAEVDTPFVQRSSPRETDYPEYLSEVLPEEPPEQSWACVSLFCGCGGVDLGFRSAGVEAVYANDVDATASETYEKNLGRAVDVRDVREVTAEAMGFEREADVLTGGFPCFPAGTMITTDRGLVPIERVRVGDSVETHLGRRREVSVVMKKWGARFVRLRAMGAQPVDATPEHPFFARKRLKAREGAARSFGEPGWVNAADLGPGHFLAQPIDRCAREARDWMPSLAMCRFIGRWLGDGWVVDHKRKSKVPRGRRGSRVNSRCRKAILCCAKGEAEEVAALIASAGLKATLSVERTVAKFHVSSAKLVAFLEGFGRYAHGKRLPEWVHRLTRDRKRAIWGGWVAADGCEGEGFETATTVSPLLALSMARIARSAFERAVSVVVVEKPAEATIEGRTVKQRRQFRLTLPRRNKVAFVEDGIAWVPLRSAEAVEGSHDVFNLEVEEDNSYVAGSFAVHNCVTFSTAGKRAGVVDDMNGQLYLQLCRLIEEVKPRYFVAENVRGILSANGGNAVKLVLAAFMRLGYFVEHRLVNMADHGVPQTRERVIFVGVRKDQMRGSFPWPKRTHKRRNDGQAHMWLLPAVTLRDAIGDLPEPGSVIAASMAGDQGFARKRAERGADPGRDDIAGRSPDEPVQAVTRKHPPHVVVRSGNNRELERGVDEPAHTLTGTSEGGGGRPPMLVANQDQETKGTMETSYGSGRRFASSSDPSPTIASASGTGTPAIARKVANQDEVTTAGPTAWGCSGRGGDPDSPAPTIAATHASGVPMRQVERSSNGCERDVDDTGYTILAEGPPSVGRSSNGRSERDMDDTGYAVLASAPPSISNHEPNDAPEPAEGVYYDAARDSADPGQPAPTARSHGKATQHFIRENEGDPGPVGHKRAQVNHGLRRMTVRECARVQTFPDWFEFVGGMSAGYRQVGNAVPPLYAKKLARALLAYDEREIIK